MVSVYSYGYDKTRVDRYIREAEYYTRQAEKFERDAEYYMKQVHKYMKDAEYYSKKGNASKTKTYMKWATDKATYRQSKVENVRNNAQLRIEVGKQK